MTKSSLSKRLIALVLAIFMIAGILPISVFADDMGDIGDVGNEEPGTWGSLAKFEYEDGVFTVRFPANRIADIMSTRKLTKDDILDMIPNDIKDAYDEYGLVGTLLSSTMAEVVDLGELVAYFPEETFDKFFTDEVVNKLKVVFGIRSEDDLYSEDPEADHFTEAHLAHFHIQDIFLNDVGAERLSEYINIDYITDNLEDDLVNAVIANMTEEALSKMIEKADIDTDDFKKLMDEYPNLINDLMTVLMTKTANNIAEYIDLTTINIEEKFKELGFSEIISQLSLDQLKAVLQFNLTGAEYDTLVANIDVNKLIAAMEDNGVDFSALINADLFTSETPSAAATALINKIREKNATSDLMKLSAIDNETFKKLPIDKIFDAKKADIFSGLDNATLEDLVENGLAEGKNKKDLIKETIDVSTVAGYLDDAFVATLYGKGLISKESAWFSISETEISAYATEKGKDATWKDNELQVIQDMVKYFAGNSTLNSHIDFDKALDNEALVSEIIPKMVASITVDSIVKYFDQDKLFNILWNDEERKTALVNAAVSYFDSIESAELYEILSDVGYSSVVDVKKSVKFILDNFSMDAILGNYIVEDELVDAILDNLFDQDPATKEYKVISPEDFVELGIDYNHYMDVTAFINLILENEFKVGAETVDAKYVIEKLGLGIIKIDEVAKYLFEKDTAGNYCVISPRNLIDTMSYKESFMQALIDLIVDQIKGGQLAPQVIVDAYSDVISSVVDVNGIVKLLPKYIFNYLNDDDKAYFGEDGSVDRSTFVEVVIDFIIEFICKSDNIKINTVFNSEDNANFADLVLNGTESEEEVRKFFDSFVLVGKANPESRKALFHTGEHGEDTMPILTEAEEELYDGYRTGFVSLANAYKALLDLIPDISVFTNIPEDGIVASANIHFDLRQWMDDFYLDNEGAEATYEIDLEAWKAAKKEVDFGIRVGLYEETPEVTYGAENKTAIEYIEDFVQNRIDEGNNYEISIEEDGTRLIDVDLVIVKKYTNIIARALKSDKIPDKFKSKFLIAINGTVNDVIEFIEKDLTTDDILDLIDKLNDKVNVSALDAAERLIEKNEKRINSVRNRVLSLLKSLPARYKKAQFIERFYRGNGLFSANGTRTVGTATAIKKATGFNRFADQFLAILNKNDNITIKENFDITLENVYQIKFQDKNGTLMIAYLPAGTDLSLLTRLVKKLSDGCCWYIKNEKGEYEKVTKMPAADTVVYKAYTVTFYDGEEAIAERDFIHGTSEVLGLLPAIPIKAGSGGGKWMYKVNGEWAETLENCNSSTIANAQYELESYNVYWYVDDVAITSTTVKYGEIPTYPYDDPTKEADENYTYTFTGWEDENGKTPEEIEIPEVYNVDLYFAYYAQFDKTINKFTITWKNYDGTVIYEDKVGYGELPVYDEETYGTPTKPADGYVTYFFDGWDPEVVAATEDAAYTAKFYGETETFTVYWRNYDGWLLEVDENVLAGTNPEYNGPTPTRAADAKYTYVFYGWHQRYYKDEHKLVCTAIYHVILNEYKITWLNYDGTVLAEDMVGYDRMPVYTGATPEREANAQTAYKFIGWEPTVVTVTGEATYTAKYKEVPSIFTVTWMNGDEVLAVEENVKYGTVPVYTGETPVKEATVQYTYKFVGWEPEVAAVTKDVTYTAKFSEVTNKYTITWMNGDKVLATDEVEYGKVPAYTGATPTKATDDEYKYTFSGWTPEVVAVTGDATYNAEFTASEAEKLTAIFIIDGKEYVVEYREGEDPLDYAPAIPAKEGYDGHWEKSTDAAGRVVYNIVYVAKTYEVIFVMDDGTEKIVTYTYGATSVKEPNIPSRFWYSSAWENYELNKEASIRVEIIYTLNLWWLIILLAVIAIVEVVVIVLNKKKNDKDGKDGEAKDAKKNGEKAKLNGGAFFLAGSIFRIIPSFGIVACIILGVAVVALGVFCVIVCLKGSKDKEDSVKWEDKEKENKSAKKN